jgi:hypothetical protein
MRGVYTAAAKIPGSPAPAPSATSPPPPTRSSKSSRSPSPTRATPPTTKWKCSSARSRPWARPAATPRSRRKSTKPATRHHRPPLNSHEAQPQEQIYLTNAANFGIRLITTLGTPGLLGGIDVATRFAAPWVPCRRLTHRSGAVMPIRNRIKAHRHVSRRRPGFEAHAAHQVDGILAWCQSPWVGCRTVRWPQPVLPEWRGGEEAQFAEIIKKPTGRGRNAQRPTCSPSVAWRHGTWTGSASTRTPSPRVHRRD